MYLSIVSPIVAILIGRKERCWLWWLVLLTLIFDLHTQFAKLAGYKLVWQGNLLEVIELFFVLKYYQSSFKHKTWLYLSGVGCVIYFLIHTLYLRQYDAAHPLSRLRYNPTGATLIYLMYIILAMVGFYKLITGPLIDDILRSRRFWVNVTYLIYASGVFFMFIFAERIRTQDIKLGALLWSTVFCGLNITKNMLLAKAFSVKDGAVEP